MKKNFSIYDALFIVALVFKLRHWEPVPTWFEVFCPYVIELGIMLIVFLFRIYGISSWLEQWLTRKAIAWRVRLSARKAKKFVNGKYNEGLASRNPGRVVDREKHPGK